MNRRDERAGRWAPHRSTGRGKHELALIWVAFLAAAVVSCAPATSQPATESDVQYTEGEQLDVIFPEDRAGSYPVVVVAHGAGLDRKDYQSFAELVAASGAVVFNIDWHVLPSSPQEGLEDIACAVRYARAHAEQYGGDAGRVVLVGHSTGAAYAGEVATDGDSYRGNCRVGGSALPDALAVLSPAFVPGGPPWSDLGSGANPTLRVVVVHGEADQVVAPRLSERTVDLLELAGYQASLELVPGGHFDLVMVGRQVELQEIEDDDPALITANSILELVSS